MLQYPSDPVDVSRSGLVGCPDKKGNTVVVHILDVVEGVECGIHVASGRLMIV